MRVFVLSHVLEHGGENVLAAFCSPRRALASLRAGGRGTFHGGEGGDGDAGGGEGAQGGVAGIQGRAGREYII